MRSKNIKKGFSEYISGMNKIFARLLLITFVLGGLAMLGLAVMLIADRINGINVIEAEAVPIVLYILRSICFAEFFLLLFDYAARRA